MCAVSTQPALWFHPAEGGWSRGSWGGERGYQVGRGGWGGRVKRQLVLNHQRRRMGYRQLGGAAEKSQSERLSNLEAESRPEETSDCV